MRVLHIFCVNEIGGAETVFLNLIRYRQRADLEHCALLLADEGGALGEALTELGVPWRAVPRGRMRHPASLLRACRGIRRAVRELGADMLMANSSQAFLYARWAAAGLRVPAVLYYMGVPGSRSVWGSSRLDFLMALSRPRVVFTASRSIGSTLERWGLPNVRPVHHGTPVRPADEQELLAVDEALASHGISPEDPVLLLPGRLQPWKGQHVLVAAMPEVLRVHPRARAVLLGGTLFRQSLDYPEQLRDQAAALSVSDRVHLLGHHPNIQGWLRRATVVVHASIEPDPFPNVCIEALAARRPLVTNSISGTAEVVRNGVDALVVPPDDPKALAAALVRALDDPAARARMAESGHQRYLATCTPQHMVAPIEAELARLHQRSGRGATPWANGAPCGEEA